MSNEQNFHLSEMSNPTVVKSEKEKKETARFENHKHALQNLRTTLNQNGRVIQSDLCGRWHMSSHFFPALLNLGVIVHTEREQGLVGTFLKWDYVNDEVDDELVTNVMGEMTAISKSYLDKRKEKESNGVQSTTSKKTYSSKKKASKPTRSISGEYGNPENQLEFLKGCLEKNKLVKGYLRPEEVEWYKSMIKSIEFIVTLKAIKNW